MEMKPQFASLFCFVGSWTKVDQSSYVPFQYFLCNLGWILLSHVTTPKHCFLINEIYFKRKKNFFRITSQGIKSNNPWHGKIDWSRQIYYCSKHTVELSWADRDGQILTSDITTTGTLWRDCRRPGNQPWFKGSVPASVPINLGLEFLLDFVPNIKLLNNTKQKMVKFIKITNWHQILCNTSKGTNVNSFIIIRATNYMISILSIR